MKHVVISVRPAVNFKDTPLGLLPKEWQVVRLGEVMTPVTRDSRRISVQDNQIYALLSVGLYAHGVRVKESVFGKQLKSKVWYRAERGDFLLLKIWARKGSYGFFQADVLNPIVSGDYPILRLDEVRANPDFIGLYLSQSFVWDRLDAGAKGATNRQRVHEREFLSLTTIPLPPLAEQRAIAHVLRTVQEAKQASERVIAALRELKKSLMRHLFTYGPAGFTAEHAENAEKNSANSAPSAVNLKDTELGPIPAHWQVVRLGEVCSLSTRSLNPADSPIMRYVGLEHIESGNIKIRKWGHSSEVKSLKSVFEPGDILYGKLRPYLDKAALAEWRGICSTDILVLRGSAGVDSTFLAYIAHTQNFLDYAIATTAGVNHPRTSWQALQKMPIPLPPLAEQREIARILGAVDRRIQAEEAYARALGDLFQSLLHELMSGRRRVVEANHDSPLPQSDRHDPKPI